MSKPLVAPPDVERLVVDYLTDNLDEPSVTVGVGVPANWKPSLPAHMQVDSFVPFNDHPVAHYATVRVVAHAGSTTEAKRLAAKALGVLAAHPGGGGISRTHVLTGPDPARDDQTHAELAAVELRVTVRSIPIT